MKEGGQMPDVATELDQAAPVVTPEPLRPPGARLSHLRALEAESIYILREAAVEFARPVMLYSIGKDSSVMLRLAQRAFFPGKIPFPLLHVDMSYKFHRSLAQDINAFCFQRSQMT